MAPNKSSARETREARERLRRYNARQAVHDNQQKRRRRDNVFAVIGVIAVAALAGGLQLFYFNGGPGTASPSPTPSASATAAPEVGENTGDVPAADFAEPRVYTGSLVLNGDITLDVELDATLAPQAVSSLLADSLGGYLVDKSCHRVVTSASAGLLQCGALDAAGTPDPAYGFGPIENAPADGLYPAGTIAMARVGDEAYSNGHQFFIVTSDTLLPADTAGGYTVVGTVTSGLQTLIDTVISQGTADGAEDGAPAVPTTITSFTIQ